MVTGHIFANKASIESIAWLNRLSTSRLEEKGSRDEVKVGGFPYKPILGTFSSFFHPKFFTSKSNNLFSKVPWQLII